MRRLLLTYQHSKENFLGFATNVCKKFLAKKWISAKVCTYCESLCKAGREKEELILQEWKGNRFLKQIKRRFLSVRIKIGERQGMNRIFISSTSTRIFYKRPVFPFLSNIYIYISILQISISKFVSFIYLRIVLDSANQSLVRDGNSCPNKMRQA